MINTLANDNTYGIVIGVGQRKEDSSFMEISMSDAENVGLALTSFCGLSNLRKLLGKAATCDDIKAELNTLAKQTSQRKADLVVVYFSGHGCSYEGQYYLIGRDTENSRISETGLKGVEFVAILQTIQAEKMLILLDCCHAQGMTEPEEIPFEKGSVLKSSNRVVITAGHKTQVSYLSRPVSVFTYALIEGLGGIHFLHGDKSVTVFDLAMYIRERVVTLSKQILQIEEPQKPHLHVLENQQTTNFIVARYANGERPEMFFKEDFSSCMVAGKMIDPNYDNIQDKGYREKFNWLNVTIVGDGNYLFTNIQNSTITINNGISSGDLKDLLRGYQKITDSLMTILKNQNDKVSKELGEKIAITDIELLLEDSTPESIKAGIDKFISKLKTMEPIPQTYQFMVTLNNSFNRYKHDYLSGINTTGQLEGIIVRFLNIIEDYKRRRA